MEDLELKQYWLVIRRRLWLVIAIPIIAVLASGLYSEYVVKPTYQANTTLFINLRQNDPNLVGQAIQTSMLLTKTYSDIIKSQLFEQDVIDKLKLPMSVKQLDGDISVSSPDKSQEIEISVTEPNQPQAAKIATTLASVFTNKAKGMVNAQSVEVLNPAISDPGAKPVKPRKKLDLVIAFILGLVMSVAISFLLEYLDNRFRSQSDIERMLELPVLGSILEYSRNDIK